MRALNGILAALTLSLSALVNPASQAAPKRDVIPAVTTISMPSGIANAPMGWNQICISNPEDCKVPVLEPANLTLTHESWALLNKINRSVNTTIEQVEDLDHYGVVELWAYPDDGKGDCEDLQLLKRRMLMENGVPRQALLMTVVRDEHGAGHAVLTVRTDRGDFILDNKTSKILDWRSTGYAFVKRQSQENPNVWVSIGEPGATVTVTAGAH
jgi:predicted transglutaminase-like cysteine proteinase